MIYLCIAVYHKIAFGLKKKSISKEKIDSLSPLRGKHIISHNIHEIYSIILPKFPTTFPYQNAMSVQLLPRPSHLAPISILKVKICLD